MANLLDLPTELLLRVAESLTPSEGTDNPTLASLCLTSRLLRAVAQPILHTYVHVSIQLYPGPLWLFLRTLLEHPTLAKRVVVEILSRLPSLEHIALTALYDHPGSILSSLHTSPVDPNHFAKLKTFHLNKQYEDGPVNLAGYIPVLQLPSVERVSTENSVPTGLGDLPPTNALSHTELELFWCFVNLPTLQDLLKACSSLRSVSFVIPNEWRYRTMQDVGVYSQFAPQEFVIALLQTHSHTLEMLWADFHAYYDLYEREIVEEMAETGRENSAYVYPSFRGFDNLRRMTIEFGRLVRVRDLPEALESLNLRHCEFAELDEGYLKDLLEMKDRWCPNIREVIVHGTDESVESILLAQEHARRLGALFGTSAEDGRVVTFLGLGFCLQLQCMPGKSLRLQSSEEQEGEDEDGDEDDN
ncbi:hypothetical protein BU26DRAFT_413341 [Trematosphaeria pertusa]|uniref:F-box domain-containing protein n=1 Tax=Trematosphaeria pertusa TaxID=390896 RepID=A0A6A6J4G4_9PLEO|nr:uncharacterized protein BU26DRAFT_413341 [Trematosphaeria pertusa]KAF2256373.1 hypothetical protein BU26DRAFT_413341 [Trematosphaeria pertusa]